jgi:hypothetical protein
MRGEVVTSHAQGSMEAGERNVSSAGDSAEAKFPVKLLNTNLAFS